MTSFPNSMYETFIHNPGNRMVMAILSALDDMGEAKDTEAYVAAARRGVTAHGQGALPQTEEEASAAYEVLFKVVEDYNRANPVLTVDP